MGLSTAYGYSNLGKVGYGSATGGIGSPVSATVDGVSYNYLTFTSDGTLTVATPGLFDVLLVGGGGGGGADYDGGKGGGGGAGQYVVSTAYFQAGSLAVDVGAGGAGILCGFSSQIGTATNGVTAAGGGNGSESYSLSRGGSGGSGGGTYGSKIGFAMGFGGNNGGPGFTSPFPGGGGGGAGAVGGTGSAGNGGAGGAGVDVSTFIGAGSSLFKAAGGGGASTTGGAGGSGIGGAGATGGGAGGSAAANTGSGGGGGGSSSGSGGSGIIYVRFKV